eukprot:scaffold74423_cov27-Tisochrysis_lutea.AAC.1
MADKWRDCGRVELVLRGGLSKSEVEIEALATDRERRGRQNGEHARLGRLEREQWAHAYAHAHRGRRGIHLHAHPLSLPQCLPRSLSLSPSPSSS